MRLSSYITVTIFSLLLLGSCQKEISENQPVEKNETKMLQVADGFSWNTTQTVLTSISITSPDASGLLSKISLYTQDPSTGSEAVASGSAGYNFNFNTSLIVPTMKTGVWAKVMYPDGSTEIQYLPINNGQIEYTFVANNKSTQLKMVESGPDCTTGCTQTITGNGQVTINNGLTYCVTASFTGTINFEHWNGGGTLRVCGTATPQNINNMGTNCHIVITEGGTFSTSNLTIDGNGTMTAWQNSNVIIGTFNMNQSGTHLTNYSSQFTISNSFSPNGKVDNYGNLNIMGSYNGNTPNGYLNNFGTMNITETMSMNHPLTNSGTLSIGGSMNLNTNSTFLNQCKITVQESVSLNAGNFTMNGGFLKVISSFTVNGNSQFILQNQSMVSALNLTLNSNISGAGSKNTIKTSGKATINGNRSVSGPIEWADNDGVLSNGSVNQFINGASFVITANATNYVPITPCNPEGFGGAPMTDTDGDGVSNELDDYPNDPSKAYDNYYPSSTGFSSLAFEDLWPFFGDFDMNDLVVDVRFNRITNAQNKVVDLIHVYHVQAVGGTFKNGFAFQLDNVDLGAVQSVTGSVISNGSYLSLTSSGLESGTEKPVVVIWDDAENVIHRVGGSFFNTVDNGYTGTADLITVNVHFSTPQLTSAVGSAPFNHFIIQNKVRGHEIHLPGYMPTSKVDATLFNTGSDATNPGTGKYYKSENNLPWGLFIAGEFDYPFEKADIAAGHLKFGIWAESSGALYPDWFLNVNGYRNSGNIYGN